MSHNNLYVSNGKGRRDSKVGDTWAPIKSAFGRKATKKMCDVIRVWLSVFVLPYPLLNDVIGQEDKKERVWHHDVSTLQHKKAPNSTVIKTFLVLNLAFLKKIDKGVFIHKKSLQERDGRFVFFRFTRTIFLKQFWSIFKNIFQEKCLRSFFWRIWNISLSD